MIQLCRCTGIETLDNVIDKNKYEPVTNLHVTAVHHLAELAMGERHDKVPTAVFQEVLI
ncbi:hemolysin activation protein [Serratia sp. 3ACOL1]|nr:hemolysin activation protein [Serratia sp. 3ACOL1]